MGSCTLVGAPIIRLRDFFWGGLGLGVPLCSENMMPRPSDGKAERLRSDEGSGSLQAALYSRSHSEKPGEALSVSKEAR